MVSQVITSTVIGIESCKILVEVDFVQSIPSVVIVGLPDTSISEAKERVRSAVKNSGFAFPNQKVVINLAPADIKKVGTNYDLPIAVGILARDGIIDDNLITMLEKLYDKLTLLLNKKNIDVIIFACPMTKQCYENIKKITKGKALFKIITLNPDISICQTNRGSREITESKRLRILKMYKKGINKFKNSDLILDNTYQTPKETVNTIIKFLKTLNNSEE